MNTRQSGKLQKKYIITQFRISQHAKSRLNIYFQEYKENINIERWKKEEMPRSFYNY
jgi:hypothetical protein